MHPGSGCIWILWVLPWFQCGTETEELFIFTLYFKAKSSASSSGLSCQLALPFSFPIPFLKHRSSPQTPELTSLNFGGIHGCFFIPYYRTCKHYLCYFPNCFKNYCKHCENWALIFDPGLMTVVAVQFYTRNADHYYISHWSPCVSSVIHI